MRTFAIFFYVLSFFSPTMAIIDYCVQLSCCVCAILCVHHHVILLDLPFCGYRLLFTMNTRPNDNIDTLLHWKDGNFIGICCFAINGL